MYNAPVDYVNLLLHGDMCEYLRNVTEYHPFENEPMPIICSIERDTEGTADGICKSTHLESRFWHPKVIVFPAQKCVQEALLSAAFSPPKCVSGSALCMRKGAAKLAAPCAVTYHIA